MSQSPGCYNNTWRQTEEDSALLSLDVSFWEKIGIRKAESPRDSQSRTIHRVTTLLPSSSLMPGTC